MTPDPFSHHPELRDLIIDPQTSEFRSLSNEGVRAQLSEVGLGADFLYTDEVREAKREAFFQGFDGDLWVFAYGSLMWNPALMFSQVHRAHLPGHIRRFILRDTLGGRGTPDAPGLMAALDTGPGGCDGLAFLIPHDRVEAETKILWQREMIGPGYLPVFLDAQTDAGPIRCHTYLADHSATLIASDISRAEQIRYLATGCGILGTSLEYLRNIARHFQALGIEDPEVTSLLHEAERLVAA